MLTLVRSRRSGSVRKDTFGMLAIDDATETPASGI